MRLLVWGSGPSGKGLHINAGGRVFLGGPRAPLRHGPALRRHDLVLDLGLEPHLLAPTQIRSITYTTQVECHCVRVLMARVYAAQLMAHVWGIAAWDLSQDCHSDTVKDGTCCANGSAGPCRTGIVRASETAFPRSPSTPSSPSALPSPARPSSTAAPTVLPITGPCERAKALGSAGCRRRRAATADRISAVAASICVVGVAGASGPDVMPCCS